MKKTLLVSCFLIFSVKLFAQQFSQYNTGTLYDSFENPAQKAFITDSSKTFSSNFLIPNFNANFYLSGDAQATLKNRLFLNQYNNSGLSVNQGKYNLANANANIYYLMLKMFTSLKGDVEMGISWQLRFNGNGLFTDDTFAAFNGTGSFNNPSYNNIFNNSYYYQSYNQFSYTYKEQITKQFSLGFKLSALLGVQYQKLAITNSNATYDKLGDSVTVAVGGTYHASYTPGGMSNSEYLPTYRNPGASISIGTMYRTEDNFIIQANIKDLGFIHWSDRSSIYNFQSSASIKGLSTPAREDSIYNVVYKLVHDNGTVGSFTTPVDGRAELSVSKGFWLNDDMNLKYSPTLIASKELFYPGFIGAFVNPIQYKNYTVSVTTTYDDLQNLNFGLQFMYKRPNWEIFIGSDKLTSTAHLAYDAVNSNAGNINVNSSYTGAELFFGFSLKFGDVIEHPMNASSIPTGEKGFLGRVWGRLFKTDN